MDSWQLNFFGKRWDYISGIFFTINIVFLYFSRTEGESVIQRGKELYEQRKTSKSLEDTYVLYEAKELDETIRSKNFKSTFVSIVE